MQWTDIEKNWKFHEKAFQNKWTKLTTADLTDIAGKRPKLVTHLHEHYKIEKPKLEGEIDAFLKTIKPAKV